MARDLFDCQRVSSATRDISPTGQKIKNTRVCSNLALGTDAGVSNGTVEVSRAA